MFEDRADLIVERAVAILARIPLKHAIAAVPNHRFATAAWAVDAVAPTNLFEQVRGATLRDERLDREHSSSGDAVASPLPAVTSNCCWELTNNPLPKSDHQYATQERTSSKQLLRRMSSAIDHFENAPS